MKLAIISDLHCHHSSCEQQDTFLVTDALRQPVNQHPVAALLRMLRESCVTADYLVMLGDLTNRVDIQGLITGWEFLKEIASGLKAKGIIVTVGNHDVDIRSIHKMGAYSDEVGHLFRWKSATYSDGSRPGIPMKSATP